MLRKFYSPEAILGGNASATAAEQLKAVEDAVLGLKTTAEKAQESLKKQVSDLEAELKTKATADEIKAHKDLIEKAQKDLVAVQEYAQNLEKSIKERPLTTRIKSMTARIGDAVLKGWDQIKKFKDSNPGQRVRIELFDEVELKAVGDMGMANIVDLSTQNATALNFVVTLPNTKVHMRSLIPTGTMDSTSITYLRETGGEGVPLPWAEATATATPKPEIDMDWIEVRMDAEYIAGWVRVSRKLLDDISAFRSFLQMRLMELYLNAEDAQILSGNGTSPQLDGLLTNAVTVTTSATINIEKMIDAVAELETSKYTATAFIMHPRDFYTIAKNKAAGSGEYDLPGIVVIQGGQLYVAGIPVYKTTAMPAGTFLVGDFAQGCQFFIRENPRIEFFDQDRDNVITNKITVRIEGRAGLAIYRVEAFVKGTISTT